MSATELTVPCVAAHLLAAGVLRFLPTDADTVCEACGGSGTVRNPHNTPWVEYEDDECPALDCTNGRRPLRAGDRIAIRADDDVPNAPASLDPWCLTVWRDLFGFRRYSLFKRLSLTDIPLRPSEVVGHLTVARVLPIKDGHPYSASITDYIYAPGDPVMFVQAWVDGECIDLSDHVDAGLVFTQGGVALELAAEDAR